MRISTGSINDTHEQDADLVLVFATRETLSSDCLVPELQERFPQATIAGCSTAGQFCHDDIIDDQPLLSVLHFEHSTVRTAVAPITDQSHSLEAGRKLGSELRASDLVAVLVLSDGINCNGSALSVSTGSEGGWELFGPERTITSSSANVLYELDGEPALELYSRYLGDRAQELPGSALLFPLAIRASNAPPETAVVRTILGVEADDSSMTFAGDVPQGWTAQLMRASFDGLIDGAERAGAALDKGSVDQSQGLCLAVSCVGRRLVLGQRADEEVEAVSDLLGSTFKLLGFYSYGELAPGLSGRCELHNQTMSLTTLCER